MTQENDIQVPQAMLDVFANYGLELPPLPRNALPALTQVESELFATGALPAWLLRGTPVSLSCTDLEIPDATPVGEEVESWAAFLRDVLPGNAGQDGDGPDEEDGEEDRGSNGGESDEAAGETPYFLCGFSGSGLQDRAFLYCYSSRQLRVAISTPFNHAYADSEREREELARILELLVLVLQCTREGAVLETDGRGSFTWVHDWQGSSFQLRNGGGEITLAGEGVEALLDYLERCRDASSRDTVESRFWVKI